MNKWMDGCNGCEIIGIDLLWWNGSLSGDGSAWGSVQHELLFAAPNHESDGNDSLLSRGNAIAVPLLSRRCV